MSSPPPGSNNHANAVLSHPGYVRKFACPARQSARCSHAESIILVCGAFWLREWPLKARDELITAEGPRLFELADLLRPADAACAPGGPAAFRPVLDLP